VFLEVRTSNTPAIALYRSSGFVDLAVRRGYYPARDGREDALIMKRELAC
jgi:ribosomal-protein-alanine N-acetyltransferase